MCIVNLCAQLLFPPRDRAIEQLGVCPASCIIVFFYHVAVPLSSLISELEFLDCSFLAQLLFGKAWVAIAL